MGITGISLAAPSPALLALDGAMAVKKTATVLHLPVADFGLPAPVHPAAEHFASSSAIAHSGSTAIAAPSWAASRGMP